MRSCAQRMTAIRPEQGSSGPRGSAAEARRTMRDGPPTTTRILGGIGVALVVALSVAFAAAPGSGSGFVRALELFAVIVLGVIVLAAVAAAVTGWLGRWPQDDAEFELAVRRAERLAARGTAADPLEAEFLELDPLRDEDFEELVRDALDELPDLLQNALAHVAVVISDGGRRAGAYGLYQGDGVHRDDHPDRIVIFRDTLRRDFGADADLLREQVVRVVRHELAHHVGFDEMGVGELGL
jgi:predicted Zn-dependent protease with MMP-like domain